MRPPKKKRSGDEEDLQIHVAGVLPLILRSEVLWWHTPNGGSRHLLEAVKLQRMGVRAGVPDLTFIFEGRAYFIELKRPERRNPLTGRKVPGGTSSDGQKRFAADAARAGAPYVIVDNVEEVIRWLNEWGLTKGSASRT